MAAKKKRKYDWEAIEKEYRMGQKSIRTIADEFNCVHTTIIRRAKREGWVQDKAGEVRQKTSAALLVAPALVQNQSGAKKMVREKCTTPTHDDIQKAVLTNVEVIRGHRKSIQKGRNIANLLASQLESAVENREELKDEIIEATKNKGDGKPKVQSRIQMMKAVSLPAHAAVLRDLSTALKNFIPLERQAFNLDVPGATLEDVLNALPGKFRDSVREALTDIVS